MPVACMLLGVLAGSAAAPPEAVSVVRVRPSKVLYLAGERGAADIFLRNNTQADQKGTLVVREEWELDRSRDVARQDLVLKPAEQKTVSVTWDLGEVRFGRALRASFLIAGQPVSAAAEFFQVADITTWWRMNMLNAGGTGDEETAKTDPFVTYTNFDNHFAYAQSPFSTLVPTADVYVAGQSAYRIVVKDRLKSIRDRQKLGIRAGAYTIAAVGGPAGYELARQHPDWFVRDERGAFNTCDMPVSPIELAYAPDQPLKHWNALAPDFSHPEVVQYGAEEIVRAIRFWGWDAVFFDGAYGINYGAYYTNPTLFRWDGQPLPQGPEADRLSAEVVRKTRQIIRQACPHVVLWYNGANPQRHDTPLQQRAALDDPYSGSLFELQGGQICNPNHAGHHWRNLFDIYLAERNAYLKTAGLDDPILNTGYMYNLAPHLRMTKEEFAASRDTWTMASHVSSLILAARIHPCVLGSRGFRPFTQFMTRYSALLWDRDVRWLPQPWKTVNVESNREVWWEECVYVKDTPTHRYTLVHLVNSPDQEAVDLKTPRDPAPARGVEVEVQVAGDPRAAQVWALQPYGYDSPVREPLQVRLEPEIDGRTLLVEVPPFCYHTLVVVREPKGARP